MSFGWCFIIYLMALEDSSSVFRWFSLVFDYLLIMNVIWNMNIFLRIIEYYWYPYMAVMWVDEMSCRKGVWKFDALREHPLGKGEATCHSSSWQFYARKIGREHSTCCERNLCIVINLYHNILWVFGLIILWHPEMSLIIVDLIVVYWSVLHLILDSAWVWYSLLLELKIPTLALHWDCLLCLRHWEAYSLQVMRTYSWNSWRRV